MDMPTPSCARVTVYTDISTLFIKDGLVFLVNFIGFESVST